MPSKAAIGFFGIFIVGSISTLFRNPFYGILIYEFLYFINPAGRWWYRDLPEIRYSFIIVIFILVSFLRGYTQFKRNKLLNVPQVKWLAVITIIFVFGFIWAVNPITHGELFVRYVKIVVFALLSYKLIDSPRKMEWVLIVYILGIFYISFVGWEIGRGSGGRLEGIGAADTDEANGTRRCCCYCCSATDVLYFFQQ